MCDYNELMTAFSTLKNGLKQTMLNNWMRLFPMTIRDIACMVQLRQKKIY